MTTTKRMQAKRIFISHASHDKKLAEIVINLLHTGAGLRPEDDIFCTSVEGLGITPGEDFSAVIKRQLQRPKVVFLLLSDNFLRSDFCKYEQGAAFMMSRKIIPLLVPPISIKDLRPPFSALHAVRIDDPSGWNVTLELLRRTLGIDPTFSQWERKRDVHLSQIRRVLANARRQLSRKTQSSPAVSTTNDTRQNDASGDLEQLDNLAEQRCAATTLLMQAVTAKHLEHVRDQIGGWMLATGSSLGADAQEVLRRDFHIATYGQLCHFALKIAELAEQEGHHPSILLDWGRIRVESWTHKTWRVSKNDLILAAKINRMLQRLPEDFVRAHRHTAVKGSR